MCVFHDGSSRLRCSVPINNSDHCFYPFRREPRRSRRSSDGHAHPTAPASAARPPRRRRLRPWRRSPRPDRDRRPLVHDRVPRGRDGDELGPDAQLRHGRRHGHDRRRRADHDAVGPPPVPGPFEDNVFVDDGDSTFVAPRRRRRVDVRPRRRHRLVHRRPDVPRRGRPPRAGVDPRRGVGQRVRLRRPRRRPTAARRRRRDRRRRRAPTTAPARAGRLNTADWPTPTARRPTSRSSSTRRARWTSANGWASSSRHWPCSSHSCTTTTRSPS